MGEISIFLAGIKWENILIIVQALIGLRLIWYLIGTLTLIWEERESKTPVGQLRAAMTGKMLQVRWEIVTRKLIKWSLLFICSIFYQEIFKFLGIDKFLVGGAW